MYATISINKMGNQAMTFKIFNFFNLLTQETACHKSVDDFVHDKVLGLKN